MSRCFPFPPPGYERTLGSEDLLDLKEAKRKEKKDRKDKKRKDREKRSTTTDGTEEKSRDKKDRKEKHREKKEKNRHKKDEKKEKEGQETSSLHDATASRNTEQRKGDDAHREEGRDVFGGNINSSLQRCHNGVKPLDYGNSEAKLVEELNKRIKEDGEIMENHFLEKSSRMEKEGKEQSLSNRNHFMEVVGKKGGVGNMDMQFVSGELTRKPMVQGQTVHSRDRIEVTPGSDNSQNGWSIVDKQNDNFRHGDSKFHEKDKGNRNDTKGAENSKENSRKSVLKMSATGHAYPSVATASSSVNAGFPLDLKDATLGEGSLKKRKDINANGFLHDTEGRPQKSHVHTLHGFSENGTKRVSSKSSDHVGFPGNIQCNDKNLSMDSWIQPQNVSCTKPNVSMDAIGSSQISVYPKGPLHDPEGLNVVPTVEDLLAEASRRPPHPDSKYLGRVMDVPSMGQWSECDDQEWLFSKKGPPPGNADPNRTEEPNVWSKAVRIESVDIYALPYVIPY